MDVIRNYLHHVHLALSRTGLSYFVSRIPSILFWSTISTGLLIGGQFLYFSVLPGNYFFSYKSPAHVSDTELGKAPVLDYCRTSNGDYPIVVNAQLRKVEPPVYVKQYQVDMILPEGSGCVEREVMGKPTTPGEYKIYYNVIASLPFGVKKTAEFETKVFTVGIPKNIYGDYSLTVNELDDQRDGKAIYKPGQNLQYAFTANALVEYFGTTEHHLVCGGKDIFIDSYSGRSTAGQKDSVNNTINIPDDLSGSCHLELRITATVGDSKDVVTQTLISNSFVVE